MCSRLLNDNQRAGHRKYVVAHKSEMRERRSCRAHPAAVPERRWDAECEDTRPLRRAEHRERRHGEHRRLLRRPGHILSQILAR